MCTDRCTTSLSFVYPTGFSKATLPMHKRPVFEPPSCLVCNAPATIKCLKCHIRVYCTRKCFFDDFVKHEHECEMHCPRLQLFQDFEKYFAPAVRIKHTGNIRLGFGMFARRPIEPGERILEDTIHAMAKYISDDVVIGDVSNCQYLDNYVKIVDIDDTFITNSAQIMFVTHGYQGFWTTFINHSCLPNCILEVSQCRKFILVTAIRPIPAGAQIYISYVGASYAPLDIRTPILEKMFGGPCLCNTCLTPKPNIELARKTVWGVIQHVYKIKPYKLFDISKVDIEPEVIQAIAKRIIALSRAILGHSDQFSDPWLAIVFYAVTLFLKTAVKKTRSKLLKRYLVEVEQTAVNTARYLGFCIEPLIKK